MLINGDAIAAAAAQCEGHYKTNVPLAQYTSWRVGGPAKYFYQATSIKDLANFFSCLPPEETVTWLGLGSNVLVRDGGIPNIVVLTLGCLKNLEQFDETTVRAEAGVSCAQVARFCARHGLTGAEFLAGIPGTMGGALAMNAGCFNGETWDHVEAVDMLRRDGTIIRRYGGDFDVAYRQVKLPEDEWFVAAYLKLTPGDKEQSLTTIRELLDRRAKTQPTGEHSCGSVFRNPPGDYSARLIEASGLKGTRHGGAIVSPKHANFIVNDDNASAKDIEDLIHFVAAEVAKQQGVHLIREVRIIGIEP